MVFLNLYYIYLHQKNGFFKLINMKIALIKVTVKPLVDSETFFDYILYLLT